VKRPELDQPLDPDFEGVDVAASSKAARICGSATAMAGVDPTRAAAAARRMRSLSRFWRGERSGRLVGEWHRGSRFWVRRGRYGETRDNKLVTQNETNVNGKLLYR
jgi:hypothetical protein